MRSVLKKILITIFSGIIISGIAVFAILWAFSNNLPDYKFLINALSMPFASIPGWLKKFLSSADKKEFMTFSGIDSYGIKSLFSKAYSAINLPSFEYTLLEIGGW